MEQVAERAGQAHQWPANAPMANVGSFARVALPEILKRIALNELSGSIEASSEKTARTIYFDRGFVVFTASTSKRDRRRLGDLRRARRDPSRRRRSARCFHGMRNHLGIYRRRRPRRHAARWIAYDVGGINLNLSKLETAATLDEALSIAQQSGMPPQNFVCVDSAGAIAWTIAGRIPRRFGFDGRLPSSWTDGTRGWDGWLDAEDYPVIRNPEAGVIWTANARVVGGEKLEKLGDDGYDLGARARQIHDNLLALQKASERDMLDVQLDDGALFMGTWRDFFSRRSKRRQSSLTSSTRERHHRAVGPIDLSIPPLPIDSTIS